MLYVSAYTHERRPYSDTLYPTSFNESFNDWEGKGCNQFVPVLGGDGTKIAPTGELFDQPLGERVEFGASLPTM